MNLIYQVTSIFFFGWIVRNTLFWVSLWQIKEYRLDRVLIHLRETGQGRKLFFSPLSILKWIAFLFYILIIFNGRYVFISQIFVTAIFTIQVIFVLKEIYEHSYKRPVLTVKTLIILFLTLGTASLFFFIPLFESFLWLVFIDRITPFLIIFFVFLFYFPTELYKDWIIEKATKKLKEHKKITVIGITGSYGKSSTKEYVSQILETKFNVLKTKGTNNTPIGIANTILTGFKKNTQIFVAEMGAYKKGEISEMCRIIHPRIGILTSINEQHLSLFGNLQNTIKTKYELIESLPKNGLAIFNGNNDIAKQLYKKTEIKKAFYECLEKNFKKKRNADIAAFNIRVNRGYVEFDVKLNREVLHLKAPLLGSHNVNNILPGIFIADYLGMKIDEIKKAVAGLLPLPKTMILKKGSTGISIIDDSFNANPEAILAVLDYMKIYKGKKILVLQPMIELGSKAKDEHLRVGKLISNVCDYLFLTNKNFIGSILKGAKETDGKCIIKVAKSSRIADFLNKETAPDDVVVFEGKESAWSLNRII